MMSFEDRFWSKVVKTDACWLWSAGKSKSGYGMIWVASGSGGGAMQYAHRVSWELQRGAIPDGMHIDHRVCRDKACVNPDHLVVCTLLENIMQPDGAPAKLKSQTHCKRGHPFTPENTIFYNNGRKCRACSLEYAMVYNAVYYQKNREKCLASARSWRKANSVRVALG